MERELREREGVDHWVGGTFARRSEKGEGKREGSK
jgi:hypothetical protein